MKPLKKLFSPITINQTTVKNRIVVPPMADFGMTAPDGLLNKRHIEHYTAFASGGAGMIFIEACVVSKLKTPRNTIDLSCDSSLSQFRLLAERIHAHKAVVLVQLLNNGLSVMPEKHISEIDRATFLKYKADFVSAALRCKVAGLDGIELHAAHGFYLNQILETSARIDEYGGNFENRVRIIQELIQEIKNVCGSNFLVSVRFGSPKISELLRTVEAIEKAGGDILDVSTGCSPYMNVPCEFPFDAKIYASSLVKKVAHIPVICAGHIISGKQAEYCLENNYADMTAIGRGHLCDPSWAAKVLNRKPLNLCRGCHKCKWYIDGRTCPALNR